MKLSTLSHRELILHAKSLAQKENELVADLIEALREINRRKIFLDMGFRSMFDFCTQKLGFSEDQAWKRLQVAAASVYHPKMLTLLRSGEAKLSHLAVAAPKLTQANADKVYAAMRGRSRRAFEAALRRIGPDGSTLDDNEAPKAKVTFECTEELLETMDKVKGLLRAKGRLKDSRPEALLEAMTAYCLEQLDPVEKAKRVAARQTKTPAPGQVTTKVVERSRYIPAAARHAVVLRDGGRCTFTAMDGRQCEATVGLQFDHIQMFCKGGRHDVMNLRQLCGPHNRLMAERQLGREFMARKLSRNQHESAKNMPVIHPMLPFA